MKKNLEVNLNGKIDSCIEEIERVTMLDLEWIKKNRPKTWVNLNPNKGQLFWGEDAWKQLAALEEQLVDLRAMRRERVLSLQQLKLKYRGCSMDSIQAKYAQRVKEIEPEINKHREALLLAENEFRVQMTNGQLPNYSLAHVAKVGLALEEDVLAVVDYEYHTILTYRASHKAWYIRIALFFSKKLLGKTPAYAK